MGKWGGGKGGVVEGVGGTVCEGCEERGKGGRGGGGGVCCY